MRFAFIAKHRGIWPALWMCGALGVSRGGFYAWVTRPRSARARSDEELGAKVRASFLASDRTYGARRVWHVRCSPFLDHPGLDFSHCFTMADRMRHRDSEAR